MTALCCFSPETRRSRFLLLWLHSQYETGCLSGLHFHYKPKMGIVRAWGSTRGVPEPARWRPFHGDPVLFCLGGLTSESQASHLLALPATLIRICCESDLELPGMGPPNPGSDGLALSAASPASQPEPLFCFPPRVEACPVVQDHRQSAHQKCVTRCFVPGSSPHLLD